MLGPTTGGGATLGGASGSKNPGANLHRKASLAWLACNERWNNGSLKLEISGIIANSEKQLFCFPEFALVGSMCEGDEIFVSEFVSENCDGFGFSAGFIVPSGSTAATGRLPLSLAQPAIFLTGQLDHSAQRGLQGSPSPQEPTAICSMDSCFGCLAKRPLQSAWIPKMSPWPIEAA